MGLWEYSGAVDIRGWAYLVFITIADGLSNRLKDIVSTITSGFHGILTVTQRNYSNFYGSTVVPVDIRRRVSGSTGMGF